ncbi:hypothetical protein C3489_14240, partial [Streptomyces sp. Ru71]
MTAEPETGLTGPPGRSPRHHGTAEPRTGPFTGPPSARPPGPGLARSLPVIDLLDDDVDLAPARHLPPATPADGAGPLTAVRERLGET